MKNPLEKAKQAAAFLLERTPSSPRIGLLAGTGLGDAFSGLKVAAAFDYDAIPHFPLPTVESHAGRLLAGDVQGRSILLLQGRFHLYEGRSPAEVVFPVRVLQEMGVRRLIVTNAAGGLNPAFRPGDIMLIGDHLNLTGENPLVGPNEERWGDRFPDMSAAYDPGLLSLAERAAAAATLPLRRGVYAGLKGPSLETPAEIRFLRAIGADAVGFSTVMEVIAAVHGGMAVLGLSVVTNVHDPDRPEPASVDAIIATARQAAPRMGRLVNRILDSIDDGDCG
ncbi:MAG: purine-nucleoside phosphorylase [Desulfobacterales bacterium]|jgi:purine-nucleoside phosphorylase|nr:purine-nucleoside phosphorylase [Desulfobacterales bacterium]